MASFNQYHRLCIPSSIVPSFIPSLFLFLADCIHPLFCHPLVASYLFIPVSCIAPLPTFYVFLKIHPLFAHNMTAQIRIINDDDHESGYAL